MEPILLDLPLPGGRTLPVHSYGLFLFCGFALATWISSREAERRALPGFAYDLGLVMLISGLLGARAFYYVANYEAYYSGAPLYEFFKIWQGGLVFYGGAIGGLLSALVYLRVRRLPFAPALDVVALGAPLGMAVGRVGCFLNGCCFGVPSGLAWPLGVVFPATSQVYVRQVRLGLIDEAPPVAVHPVQLYEALSDVVIFICLKAYFKSSPAPGGSGMPLLMVLYGASRFALEALRGDVDSSWSGLTSSQNVSIVVVSMGLVALGGLGRRRRGPETQKKSEKAPPTP